jgi:predicted SAM-dependent methyltransferase
MEIGALWRRFPVPRKARVWYVDRLSRAGLQLHYPELKDDIVTPDLLADAAQLPVPPATLDFLIASHVLEHLPLPLRALRSWYDALAPGGVLLLKIPDMRYSFDVHRPRTTLAHLLQEHANPEGFDNRAHYAEWVEKVGGHDPSSPGFEATVQHLMEQNHSIHFHAWIDDDVRELVHFTQQTWQLEWGPVVFWGARFYRKEITLLLLRK